MSTQEWQARVDLAACYRLVAHHGWTDLIYTHISLRVPGTAHYLINPYGWSFDEITASSFVKIDAEGQKVGPSPHVILQIHGTLMVGGSVTEAFSSKLNKEPVEEYLKSNVVLMKNMIANGYADARTLSRRIEKVEA